MNEVKSITDYMDDCDLDLTHLLNLVTLENDLILELDGTTLRAKRIPYQLISLSEVCIKIVSHLQKRCNAIYSYVQYAKSYGLDIVSSGETESAETAV